MLGFALPVLGALAGAPLFAYVGTTLSVRAEAGAGAIPTGPDADSVATVDAIVEPQLGVLRQTPRSRLALSLSPRFYQREPNFTDVSRPLVLGRATLSHSYDLTRRLTWSSGASTSYGEVDYSVLGVTFDAPLTTRLEDPVLTAFTLDAETGLRWAASRRQDISVAGSVQRYEPVGEQSSGNNPASIGVGFDVALAWRLDRRSTLSLPVAFRQYWVDPGVDTSTASLSLGYARRFNALSGFEAEAGMGVERFEDEYQPYPRAMVAFDRILHKHREALVSNRVALSLDARFDPTIGEARQTAWLEAGLQGALGTSWLLFFTMAGSTAVSSEPLSDDALDSMLAARVGASHRLTRAVSIEFGGDVGARASHLTADEFRLADRRVRAFVAVAAITEFGSGQRSSQSRNGASVR